MTLGDGYDCKYWHSHENKFISVISLQHCAFFRCSQYGRLTRSKYDCLNGRIVLGERQNPLRMEIRLIRAADVQLSSQNLLFVLHKYILLSTGVVKIANLPNQVWISITRLGDSPPPVRRLIATHRVTHYKPQGDSSADSSQPTR